MEKNVIESRKKFIKLWKLYLGLTQNLIKLVMDIHTQSSFKICLINDFFFRHLSNISEKLYKKSMFH